MTLFVKWGDAMFASRIAMAMVATSLVALPATRVQADAGDVAAGLLLGVIGSAAVNSAKKKTTTKKTTSTVSAATRAETKEVQTSLNYFGFPAGSPDGVMGKNTRNAISQYQVFLGYPATGQLTEYEKTFLTSSYHRAIAGGQVTTQLVAVDPMGTKGLLKQYQAEAAGLTTQQQAPGVMVQAPVQTTPSAPGVVVVQTAPTVQVPAPTPTQPVTTLAQAAPVAPTAVMPSFAAAVAPQKDSGSLSSHCNKVSLVTSSNGGYLTTVSMTDPDQALGEQFCLARTYAVSQGEQLESAIQGFTPQMIADQCRSMAPLLQTQVSGLGTKPAAQITQEVTAFALNSGMSSEQLVSTAKICLSVGYRTDDMQVALTSALLLSSMGETPYAELLGHHVGLGFGVAGNPSQAMGWYQMAFDAINAGATPVFAPGQPERTALIQQAAFASMGGAAPVATSPVSMPTFVAPN